MNASNTLEWIFNSPPAHHTYNELPIIFYYKKKISEEFALEYQLADTYPMEVLEERFKKMQTELEPSED